MLRVITKSDHTCFLLYTQGGGGLEQAGASVAVDELLLQSHEGYLVLFPAWERGVSAGASFMLFTKMLDAS